MSRGIQLHIATSIRELVQAIEPAQRIILTTHMNPDCDGLGSEAALYEGLTQYGKSVAVLNNDATAEENAFLDESGVMRRYSASRHRTLIRDAQMVILLDAADPARVGRLGKELASFKGATAVVDHHEGSIWGNHRIVDPGVCSTTTLVLELLKQLGARVTPRMASALYAGVLVDTLSFRNANTTPECLRAAAEMIELGADAEGTWRSLFADWPIGRIRLQGEFLASLRTSIRGRLIWGVVDARELQCHRQSESSIEGFVERALDVRGAELAILFVEESPEETRVSLRSREPVRVDDIARSLGGGGHRLAAGAILDGPPNEVVPAVLRRAKAHLRRASLRPFDQC